MMKALRLYFSPTCPYAQRVTISCYELGLISSINPKANNDDANTQVELVEIDLKNKPEYYIRDINPLGKVPALELLDYEVNGKKKVLIESGLISEYIAMRFKDKKRLISENPLDHYHGSFMVDLYSSTLQGLFYNLLRAQETAQQDAIKTTLLDNLKKFNAALISFYPTDATTATSKPFLISTNEPTYYDIQIASFVARFFLLKHFRGFELPQNDPALERVNVLFKALTDHSALKATLPPVDVLTEANKAFAENKH